MSFFSDKEHRILLSALRRERQVCEAIDRQYMHEPYDELLTDICKSIERKVYDLQHKYRWHDLRKDPDDFPTWGTNVLVCDGFGTMSVSRFGFRAMDGDSIRGFTSPFVVAWREIEPLEESEEWTE